MKRRLLLVGFMAILLGVLGYGQAARTQQSSVTGAPSAAVNRALLDQYCVACHNDQTKKANLSLEKLDLATVGDNPQLWEKVVRKLRAGVMPPPGMQRPDFAAYSALT